MKELIEYIVKTLVDDPTQVQVTETVSGAEIRVELRVGPHDMGRVIGRNGRVINALRTLAQASAARQTKRAYVEIIETGLLAE